MTLDFRPTTYNVLILAKHQGTDFLCKQERSFASWQLDSQLSRMQHLRSIFATAQVAIHNVTAPERTPSDFLLNEGIAFLLVTRD
jgi:hypothetical protein